MKLRELNKLQDLFYRGGARVVIEIYNQNLEGFCTKTILAKKTNLCYSHMTELVGMLSQHGLVETLKVNRIVLIKPTQKGLDLMKQLIKLDRVLSNE